MPRSVARFQRRNDRSQLNVVSLMCNGDDVPAQPADQATEYRQLVLQWLSRFDG